MLLVFERFVLRKQQQHTFFFILHHATARWRAPIAQPGYFVHALPLLPIAVAAAVEVVPSTP